MTYTETLDYLFAAMPSFQNIGQGAYKPGLERIESFCQQLDNPHLKYEVIHIAGTNGKGSVSHTIASVVQHGGYRVGLFTSPHLRDFRERIRINGAMISEAEVVAFVTEHRERMESLGLSFFEMTAAMAFWHFARHGVEMAIIETGLGGRLDATNIVRPRLSIITNIGLDHTKFLGTTLGEIAREKGGIIKPHTPIILGQRGAEYTCEIEQIAKSKESEIIFAEDISEIISQSPIEGGQKLTLIDKADNTIVNLSIDLAGRYQAYNIITVYAVIKHLGITLDVAQRALCSIVETTSLIGRWQTISLCPHIICDTGHNAHGLCHTMEQLRATPHERLIMVLGFANDKDLEEILPLFDPKAHYIFTRPRIERAMPCEKIAPLATKLGYHFEIIEDVSQALLHATSIACDGDLIFVGGSNFVVAEVV